MNKTVNATVNGASTAQGDYPQVLENKWRRVGESNSCARICNPSKSSESKEKDRKRLPFQGVQKSTGYKPTVNRKVGTSLGQLIKPAHKRMSRMLGYCLTVGTADLWSGFSFVAAARLTETERASLAFSALKSLGPDQAEIVATASIGSAGAPMPAFLGGMDDARFWASYASRTEHKAYALAAYEAMSARDQAAFFQHISQMEIAA